MKECNAAPSMPLADRAYAAIKEDLFEFRLLPGERFSENEVAARLGVSRTPVREALYRLEREGYLTVQSKSGWSVRGLDFERFDHLYEVRTLIELAALRRLAAAETLEAVLPLKAVWLVPASARLDDAREVARLDEQFHLGLVGSTGNPEMLRIHLDVTERIRVIRRLDFTKADRIESTYQEHGQILRAVLSRKVELASTLLTAHIERSQQEVRRITLHMIHLAHRDGRKAGATTGPARARGSRAAKTGDR